MKRIITFLLAIAAGMPMVGQAPQIPLTGNVGAGGLFSFRNAAPLVMPSDANTTLSYPTTSAGFVKVTSSVTLTAQRNVIEPFLSNAQCFENATTGGQSIQVIGTTGTGVVIANGSYQCVQGDLTNYVSAGAGSGSGVVLSGSQYFLPFYTISPTGTTVGPSGISTNSAGTTLNIPVSAVVGPAISGNTFTMKNVSTIPATWVFDVTSPATALASLGGGAGGTPCTTTANSLQFNNAGAFGCAHATDNGTQFTYTEPISVTSGTPGISATTLQETSVTVAGCATFDAAGNLSSTNVACAGVAGVTGINTLTGAVTFSGGSNIALTTVGNNITINGLVNAPTQTEYTPGGARAVSTVYQNLTTHLLFVTVFFLNSNTSTFGTAFGYQDATTTPVQYAGGCTAPAASGSFNTPCSFTFAVPPSHYYEITEFGALTNFNTWFESTP